MKALAFIVIQLFSLIFSQFNLSGSYVSIYGNSVNNFNFLKIDLTLTLTGEIGRHGWT